MDRSPPPLRPSLRTTNKSMNNLDSQQRIGERNTPKTEEVVNQPSPVHNIIDKLSLPTPLNGDNGEGVEYPATTVEASTTAKEWQPPQTPSETEANSAGDGSTTILKDEQKEQQLPPRHSLFSPKKIRFSIATRLSDASASLAFPPPPSPGAARARLSSQAFLTSIQSRGATGGTPADAEAQRNERQSIIDSFACLNASSSLSASGGGVFSDSYNHYSHGESSTNTGGTGGTRARRKNSSLFLRKLPTDILLKPPVDFEQSERDGDDDAGDEIALGSSSHSRNKFTSHTTTATSNAPFREEDEDKDEDEDQPPKLSKHRRLGCLISSLCLSPKFTLQKQLMLAFGSVNLFTIVMMIIGSVMTTSYVGEFLANVNDEVFQDNVVRDVQATTTRYLVESLERRFLPLDLVNIVREATQDRFQGYSTSSWSTFLDSDENDQDVPFRDMESGTNRYPIMGNDMPLGWQVPADLNEDNYHEHVQQFRWDDFYKLQTAASTANAVFFMQGACDPKETNESASYYWPNCTDANNNVTTGGVIRPTPLTRLIYDKSSDLVPLLKAIFEATPVIQDLGLYFANMGAGAVTSFPAFPLDNRETYTSNGCDWMSAPNPIDPKLGPIGTPEEIAQCRPSGTVVSNALYNPLEDSWCRDQALNPYRLFTNPVVDTWNVGRNLIVLGRAIYDRQTKAFIACTIIAISLSQIDQILQEALLTNRSKLSLVQFGEAGKVVTSTDDRVYVGDTERSSYTIDQLQLGLSQDSYQELLSLVNYTARWDPIVARQAYRDFWKDENGFLVAVSPLPMVPAEYDPYYQPDFFIVSSNSKDDIFEASRALTERLNRDKKAMIAYSIMAGAVGLAVTTIFIFFMSNALTAPLHYINKTADNIVNGFGEQRMHNNGVNPNPNDSKRESVYIDVGHPANKEEEKIDPENANRTPKMPKNTFVWCTPKTELRDLLDEFDKMVATFSGSLLAKSERGTRIEVRNKFNLRKEFADLYASRKDASFAYNLDIATGAKPSLKEVRNKNLHDTIADTNGFIHLGSNIEEEAPNPLLKASSESSIRTKRNREKRLCSRLFLWTSALLVTPLLVTSIVISGLVYFQTRLKFERQLKVVEETFMDLRRQGLSTQAKLRAEVVSSVVQVSVRDLYILTRYYSWLLFGGLNRADTFTELLSGVEECKTYSDDYSQCPFVQETSACDCAWNDRLEFETCQNYPDGSRRLQKATFSVESGNALSDGDRNFSSFPRSSTSPETTAWWDDVTSVPGSEKGSSAAGYDTLYDRLRVASAMPLFPVLYNYDPQKTNYIAQYVGFEADGLLIAYSGCDIQTIRNSGWISTEENGAATIRPDLCPLGKYGYDARCRHWYDSGRKLALEKNSSLYVTAPYLFADLLGTIAQTATSPLVDPNTGEHVGQVNVDFSSKSVFDVLDKMNTVVMKGGFPILIAIEVNDRKETVIGPGFSLGDAPIEIAKLVLSADFGCDSDVCKENLDFFDAIVKSMYLGESSTTEVRRSTQSGEIESFIMAYSPINVKSIRPVDSSDFARGIEVSDHLVYSFALSEMVAEIKAPFLKIKNKLVARANLAMAFLVIVTCLFTLLAIYISYIVTSSIAERMLYLLDLITSINREDFEGELPKFENDMGSREITNVADTVVVLYKVVRAANDFYFAGELERAYVVLVDALRIFKSLGNKKAVAVASNNLGNVLLAMYNGMKDSKTSRQCGLTKQQIIGRGMGHFHRAITLGEKAYDEFYIAEGWTPNCLDFMQHLSNRYFNRGLFLLLVKDDHDKPDEIAKLGIRDLVISRDMDFEIVEYGKDMGFNRENRAHKLFCVNLVRARGHNKLLEVGYPDAAMAQQGYPEDWGLAECLDENFKLLQLENKRESSELFKDINVLGRLQEIETELIKHKMMNDDLETAARIAIRMLQEDAYVFVEAIALAVDALITYVDTMTQWEESTRSRVKRQLMGCTNNLDDVLVGMLNTESGRGSNLSRSTEAVSLVRATSGLQESSSQLFVRNSAFVSWVKNHVSGGFVTMEDF